MKDFKNTNKIKNKNIKIVVWFSGRSSYGLTILNSRYIFQYIASAFSSFSIYFSKQIFLCIFI